ncbi:hypothetical protein JCM9533A_23110 [Catenuloplanes niger JCM 9533]
MAGNHRDPRMRFGKRTELLRESSLLLMGQPLLRKEEHLEPAQPLLDGGHRIRTQRTIKSDISNFRP